MSSIAPATMVDLLVGSVPRQRRSAFYNLGVVAVAAAMVVLPLIYVALLVAVGWLMYLHAVKGVILFENSVGRGGLELYFGPLIVGVIALVFLVKPLFTRAVTRKEYTVLDRDSEPLLHAYVARLAQVLGAPAPREIRVDNNVNASAGFRRGVVSFLGNDLVLTIGAPLLAGMSLRQITGVMAHELGHFAQGGAMRVSYVIRAVNWWFARVVYERDAFDAQLAAGFGSKSLFFIIVCAVAKGMIWVSRYLLGLLMRLGVLISAFQLRQMEYDADRCEVLVAGSAEFAATARRLQELSIGSSIVSSDMSHFAVRGAFPDSLGDLAVAMAARVDTATMDDQWRQALAARTGRMATHPCDADRIARADALASAGLVTDPAPASALLADAARVQRAAGAALYAAVLPSPPAPDTLLPVAEFLSRKDHALAVGRAWTRYVTGDHDFSGLRLPDAAALEMIDVEDARGRLSAAHAAMRQAVAAKEKIADDLWAERIAMGARLALAPESAGGADSASARSLLEDLQRLQPLVEQSLAINGHANASIKIIQEYDGELPATAQQSIAQHAGEIARRLGELMPLVTATTLNRPESQAMLRNAAVAQLPAAAQVVDLLNIGRGVAMHVLGARADLIAELVYLAQQVEESMDLTPLGRGDNERAAG